MGWKYMHKLIIGYKHYEKVFQHCYRNAEVEPAPRQSIWWYEMRSRRKTNVEGKNYIIFTKYIVFVLLITSIA